MAERKYKYIDEQALDADVPEPEGDPLDVLFESLLDILQLAESEGFLPEEVDVVLQRVMAYRGRAQNDT